MDNISELPYFTVQGSVSGINDSGKICRILSPNIVDQVDSTIVMSRSQIAPRRRVSDTQIRFYFRSSPGIKNNNLPAGIKRIVCDFIHHSVIVFVDISKNLSFIRASCGKKLCGLKNRVDFFKACFLTGTVSKAIGITCIRVRCGCIHCKFFYFCISGGYIRKILNNLVLGNIKSVVLIGILSQITVFINPERLHISKPFGFFFSACNGGPKIGLNHIALSFAIGG